MSSPGEVALSMRILALEYSMQTPLSNLDPTISPLTSLPIPLAPVIHLFGPSLSGQKVCVHIHGVLPYFFVPLPKDVKLARDTVAVMAARLGASLERALSIALKGHGPYVHDVCAVRGKPFYGYHDAEAVFFKIFLYSPYHVARAVLLLRTGAVMSCEFQPHEAHIPYLLQFFADFNLAGMAVLRLSSASFRYPVPVQRSFVWNDRELLQKDAPDPHGWIESKIGARSAIWSPAPARLSSCELEVDATSDAIVNAQDALASNLPASSTKLVRSLAQICDDPVVAAAGPAPQFDKSRPPPLTIDRFQLHAQAERLQELLKKDAIDFELAEVQLAAQDFTPDKQFLQSTPAAMELRSTITARHRGDVGAQRADVNEDLASQSSDGDIRDILQWMARENELEAPACEDDNDEERAGGAAAEAEQQQEAKDIVEASQAYFAEAQREEKDEKEEGGGKPGNIPVFAQLDGSGDEAPRHKRTKLRLTSTAAPPPAPTPTPAPAALAAAPVELKSILKRKEERLDSEGVSVGSRDKNDSERPAKMPVVHEYRRSVANALPLMPPPSSSSLSKKQTTPVKSIPPPVRPPVPPLPHAPASVALNTVPAIAPVSIPATPNLHSAHSYPIIDLTKTVSPPAKTKSSFVPIPPTPLVVPTPPALMIVVPSSQDITTHTISPAFIPATAIPATATPIAAPAVVVKSEPSTTPPPIPLSVSPPPDHTIVATETRISIKKEEPEDRYTVPPLLSFMPPLLSARKCSPPVPVTLSAVATEHPISMNMSPQQVESHAKWLIPSPTLSLVSPPAPLTHEAVRFPPAPHRKAVAAGLERVAHYADPSLRPSSVSLPFFPSYLPRLSPYTPPLPVRPPPPKRPLNVALPRVYVTLTPARLPPSRTDVERWLLTSPMVPVKHENLASQLDAPTGAGAPQHLTVTGRAETRQSLTVMYVEVLATARADLKPDPALDPLHAIVVIIHDEEAKDVLGSEYQPARTVFMLSDTPAPPLALPASIRTYATEELLLDAFAASVRMSDPDIVAGWEVQGGSIGYLLSRHARLRPRAPPFSSQLGRLQESAGPGSAQSAPGTGGEESYSGAKTSGIHLSGRVVLNLWRIMRTEVKLQSFTLSAFVYTVLGVRMPVHSPAVLQKWWQAPALKSIALAHIFRLLQAQHSMLEKLDVIPRTAELARVFGIDFFSVLSRGSQYRVESMVLRLSKPLNYILASPTKQQVAGQRAAECIPLVMEPQSRFYTSPVLVLDFQSLYPSIIIAYNYCFSTCLGKMATERLKRFGALSLEVPAGVMSSITEAGLTIAPNEVLFIRKAVREGVLPRMLREILDTRVQVKAAMKKHTHDPAVSRMLNARQLGLKMIANVTYGYTGASFSGRMPCVDIADAIVLTARQTLENAIALVHSTQKWRARVVYGDTDSLFIELPGATREQAFQVGNDIANAVSAANPSPVKLAFEKVYHPCVLVSKKRYVGYKWESPTQGSASFEAKGIETVRRDTCPAVAKIMEKSLRVLFEKGDLASVKAYLDRQCAKLREDRVSLRELIFAKEVRLGTYSDRVPPPPAAIVAMKRMAHDPQSEPRYGERVPYVVVAGPPSARLIDLVVSPETFIASAGRMRLNSTYYITKCVLPALERVLGLAGADVKSWFAQMPRARSVSVHKHTFFADATRAQHGGQQQGAAPRRTLDQYYLTVHCPMCDTLMKASAGLCDACRKDPQRSGLLLFSRLRRVEKEHMQLTEICMSCTGLRTQDTACSSLDCPVFFERVKVNDTLRELEQVRAVLQW